MKSTFNQIMTTVIALAVCQGVASAQLSWTGAVSSDPFDIANWDTTGSTVVGPLAANTNVDDNVVVSGSFANNPITPELTGQVRFQLGDGFSLTLDGATWGIDGASNEGHGGDPDGTGPTDINVINGSTFNTFFIVNHVSMKIDATSSVTFGGGGNPVNNGSGGPTTIDMEPGANLFFSLETPTQFVDEHLSKLFVNGAPAVEGVNITISDFNGAAGSQIIAVPEPTAIGLLGLAAMSIVLIRRGRS